MAITATVTKTKEAEPTGEYRRTAVDDRKDAADFRIVGYAGKASIVWRDGRHERVTSRQLARLQAVYTWAPDL